MTPFKALYGYDPPQPTFELIAQSKVEFVDQLLKERQIISKQLRENLIKAQARMKQYAYSKISERTFEVGDLVFIKLQPYRQSSVIVRKNLKLSSKFFGPYPIIKKISSVAYELQLPVESRIHPVFHVFQLKKKLGPKDFSIKEQPLSTPEGQLMAEPVAILNWRMVKRNNQVVTQILVQWANLAPEDATWEDYSFITSQFPEFQP